MMRSIFIKIGKPAGGRAERGFETGRQWRSAIRMCGQVAAACRIFLPPQHNSGSIHSIDRRRVVLVTYLIYFMGPERGGGINIDSEWLLVWLDKSGRFQRYRIVTD